MHLPTKLIPTQYLPTDTVHKCVDELMTNGCTGHAVLGIVKLIRKQTPVLIA
ncbi:hypothetical protein ACU6U9_09310 [Pseudomonas sp. HK3]|jgi:hypothetical protein